MQCILLHFFIFLNIRQQFLYGVGTFRQQAVSFQQRGNAVAAIEFCQAVGGGDLGDLYRSDFQAVAACPWEMV